MDGLKQTKVKNWGSKNWDMQGFISFGGQKTPISILLQTISSLRVGSMAYFCIIRNT